MRRNILVLLLAATPALADFSYQETSKITGGMLAGMMKVAGVFSKQAREPIQSTVALKGNRLAHRGAMRASIIDLDSKTITEIDLQKKTYSVMTFDQMKQMMDDMAQKMHQQKSDAQMDMKVSAKATGNSKQIAGYDAKEMLVRIELQGTDEKSGQSGAMVVSTDLWIAATVPGYGEMREFYRRMAAELKWTPGGNMFMGRPDVAKGMAEAMKEVSKLDGTPVYQTMTMGAAGSAGDGTQTASAAPAQQPAPQAERPSIAGALGGRFGLGRKKTQDTAPAESKSQAGPGTLLEMTTEYAGFSAASVDAGLFEVPAGFKKVEADARRMQ
jgi:carbon monoxide dehydrogenase subunit G